MAQRPIWFHSPGKEEAMRLWVGAELTNDWTGERLKDLYFIERGSGLTQKIGLGYLSLFTIFLTQLEVR